MQDIASLKHTHFGIRLQERFGVEFTLGVRKEFFSLIEKKKLRLVERQPGTDGTPNAKLVLKGYWRDHRVALVISNTGDFITISDIENSLPAYCRKVRYEKLRRTSNGEDADSNNGS